jgi:hypothetical protein
MLSGEQGLISQDDATAVLIGFEQIFPEHHGWLSQE